MLKALLDRLWGRDELPEVISYEEARAALETHSREARRQLARRPDVEPEILYYLAGDESPEIRKLVAANPATPLQANRLLAADQDADVRCELATKIGRLLPGLDTSEAQRMRDMTVEMLDILASDHLPRVRAILAEEIKHSTVVPGHIVRQLALDLELIVSAPILEYSPLLADEDLIEIIAGARAEGALAAVARRKSVSPSVSDAIVATLDIPAVAALLANANAQIREETLDRIIDHAAEIEAWHQPVVLRPQLSLRAVRRIAGFVAASLVETLQRRADLDAETVTYLKSRMRDRLQRETLAQDAIADEARAQAEVRIALDEGSLDDEALMDACDQGRRNFVIQALAVRSKLPAAVAQRILAARSAKAIVALVWRSGLSMRVAYKVQMLIAHITSSQLVLPRDGSQYPLTPEEMTWHLRYFGAESSDAPH